MVALVATGASAQESVQISETQEISATIVAVDQELRIVIVRGPEGDLTTIEAGPEVRNLAQVEVGDTIRVVYEQAFIATLTGAEVASPVTDVTSSANAKVFWAVMSWFIFVAALGVRAGGGVKEQRSALVSVLGFSFIVFPYLGLRLWSSQGGFFL